MVLDVVLSLAALVGSSVAPVPATVPAPVPAPQPAAARPGSTTLLTVLPHATVALRAAPGGRVLATAGARTAFGTRTVFAVLARSGGWARVSSADVSPRGAWVRADHRLRAGTTRWSVTADLSSRRVVVRHDGRVLRRFPVAVGAPGRTPTGRFQVTDKLAGAAYGPAYGYGILALSATGPLDSSGRIAIHGTDTPGSIGAAASAGCLRAGDRPLRWLMARLPVGTPVRIRS